MRISISIFIYTINFAYLKVYTKFEEKTHNNNNCANRSREICDRNFQSKGLSTDPWWTPTFTSNSLLEPSPTPTRLRALAYIPWTYSDSFAYQSIT